MNSRPVGSLSSETLNYIWVRVCEWINDFQILAVKYIQFVPSKQIKNHDLMLETNLQIAHQSTAPVLEPCHEVATVSPRSTFTSAA
jgi:hypothetical protein